MALHFQYELHTWSGYGDETRRDLYYEVHPLFYCPNPAFRMRLKSEPADPNAQNC